MRRYNIAAHFGFQCIADAGPQYIAAFTVSFKYRGVEPRSFSLFFYISILTLSLPLFVLSSSSSFYFYFSHSVSDLCFFKKKIMLKKGEKKGADSWD
jgi:hypothetical protein